MCNFNARFFSIGGYQRIEGKYIAFLGLIEDPASSGEAAAFGVKKNEVVGEVGRSGDEGLDIHSMEGLSSEEVSFGNAGFEYLPKGLESRGELMHLRRSWWKLKYNEATEWRFLLHLLRRIPSKYQWSPSSLSGTGNSAAEIRPQS